MYFLKFFYLKLIIFDNTEKRVFSLTHCVTIFCSIILKTIWNLCRHANLKGDKSCNPHFHFYYIW